MMRSARGMLLALVMLMATMQVAAQQAAVATPPAVAAPANLQAALRQPVVWRGTLGEDKIQLRLQPKADAEGLEGKYFLFGQNLPILLAGEVEQDDLAMEESHNGIDVSGQWEGHFQNGVLTGTWYTPDGSQSKQFVLEIAH